MPVPTNRNTQVSCPRAAPRQCSPSTARLTSFSTTTGRLEDALEDVAHGHVGPAAQVRGEGHDAAVVVDRRRARPPPPPAACPTGAASSRMSARTAVAIRESRASGPMPAGVGTIRCGERLAAQVGHGQARARGAEVDAGHEAVARVELHEGGTPAAARRPRPQLAHDAAADEMRDEAAHGGSGETGGLDQLGAREAVRAVHRHHQHAVEVEATQMPGVASGSRRRDPARARREGEVVFQMCFRFHFGRESKEGFTYFARSN